MRRPTMAAALAAATLAAGCAEQGYSVIATTATSVGLEISQAPTTRAPQFVLGYRRAEHAFVPTDRPSDAKTAAGVEGVRGSERSADVLMELRYGGGYGDGVDSAIYQRLAVGRTAVSQPGAALLFLKGPDGTTSPEAVRAAGALMQAARAEDAVRGRAIDRVMACLAPGGALDRARMERMIALASADGDAGLFTVLRLRDSAGAVREEIAATPDLAEQLDAVRGEAGCPGA